MKPQQTHTDPHELAELRERVRSKMTDAGLNQTDLSKALGLARGSLTNWLAGKYTRSTPDLDATLREWLQERPASRRVTWVETPSATRITDALAHAQASGDLVCVYGAPGTGKTCTVAHYQRSYEHAWLATITPASAAVVPALEEIAEAVGIHDVTGGARRLSRAIRSKVSHLDGLIILDEAQHLSLPAIEEIRSIHDATGVGIALVGNELVYARLTGGTRAVHFAQLFSRVGLKLYLRTPSKRDVAALVAHWKVTDPKAVALLERVAKKPGALRAVSKILRLASSGGGEIDAKRVRLAMDHLGTEDA